MPDTQCRVCGQSKPADQMRFDHRTGKPEKLCKVCAATRMRAYRAAGSCLNTQAHRLAWKYSLTVEQYDAMLAAQGGGCAICQRQCKTGRRLAVDHDHETGHVRALLCGDCNRKVGVYEVFGPRAQSYLAIYGSGNPALPTGFSIRTAPAPALGGRGGRQPASTKLTAEVVAKIRERYTAGGISQRALAREYGTSQINVSRIVRGLTWRASG